MRTLMLLVAMACVACESEAPTQPVLWAYTEDGMTRVGGGNPDVSDDASTDVGTGVDVTITGSDTQADTKTEDTQADTANVDAPDTVDASDTVTPVGQLPCDVTTTVRLVATTEDNVFYDNLLDIECGFYPTKAGMRCLPLNTMVGPSYQFKKQVGNATFPSAALFPLDDSGTPYIFNDMACKNPVFVTGDVFDAWGNPKPDPKYGFTFTSKTNQVDAAYGLYTPIASYTGSYWVWQNNKQTACQADPKANPKGCSVKVKVAATKAIAATGGWSSDPKGLCGADTYGVVSAYQTAILHSSGPATNPKCPGVIGLAIFAAQ